MPTEAEWRILNARVRSLEHRQRLTALLAIAVVIGSTAATWSARVAASTQSPPIVPRLEAEELVIRDKTGLMRARLGTTQTAWFEEASSRPDSVSRSDSAPAPADNPCYEWRGQGLETSLALYDTDGRQKAVIQVAGDCTPSLSLRDKESSAITMEVDRIGQTSMYFWRQGEQRLSLSGGALGAGLDLGVAGVSPAAISLSTGLDGAAHVNLYDSKGLRAVLGDTRYAMKGGIPVHVAARSSASLVLFDEAGLPQFTAP